MDSQQYCLKWNHHLSNLLTVFSRLLGSEQFTDVLLAVEGKTIRCHKVVLSACSSYFEQLFTAFDEKNQIVILKDTAYDDVSALVDFMYKGEINVAQNRLSSLLKTAEGLKIKGLAEVAPTGENGQAKITPTSASSTTPPPAQFSMMTGSNPKKIKSEFPGYTPFFMGSKSAESVKRKRGRPRILDSPGEVNPFGPRFMDELKLPMPALMGSAPSSTVSNPSPPRPDAAPSSGKPQQPSSSLDMVSSSNPNQSSAGIEQADSEPTPGGPLTEERIQELGIVKMNDYLTAGTRQQFWEEYYVKVIMQAVRNKEIDMKTGAEILGVSYGTLYGRYRETFGYLKHAWNANRPPPRTSSNVFASPTMVPPASMIAGLDSCSVNVLENLKYGKINIRQAAELLKVEPQLLAYELASKRRDDSFVEHDMADMDDDDDDDDYHDQLANVHPDVVIHDDDNDANNDESVVARDNDNDSVNAGDRVNGNGVNDEPTNLSTNAINEEEDVDPIATN